MIPKFEKIQETVLYNIARSRKLCKIEDLMVLTGNLLSERQIFEALVGLNRRRLIKKRKEKLGGKKIIVQLNVNQIERIKRILGKHWEENWLDDWKKITEKKSFSQPTEDAIKT